MTTFGASPCSVPHTLPLQEEWEPVKSRGSGQTPSQMGGGNRARHLPRTLLVGLPWEEVPPSQPLAYLQPLGPVNGSQRPQHPQHPEDLHHKDSTGPREEGTAEMRRLPCPGQAGTAPLSSHGGQAGASREGQGMAETRGCHRPSPHVRPSDTGSWRKQIQTEFLPIDL